MIKWLLNLFWNFLSGGEGIKPIHNFEKPKKIPYSDGRGEAILINNKGVANAINIIEIDGIASITRKIKE